MPDNSHLYGMMYGQNPDSERILSCLDLTREDVERYRDCNLHFENCEITILARTGGRNREQWPQEKLTSHPAYLRDHDCDWDETYACFHFTWRGDA